MAIEPKDFPIIGISKATAETYCRMAGYSMRVTRLDGKPCVVTRDFRTDRINVSVESGRVTAINGVG